MGMGAAPGHCWGFKARHAVLPALLWPEELSWAPPPAAREPTAPLQQPNSLKPPAGELGHRAHQQTLPYWLKRSQGCQEAWCLESAGLCRAQSTLDLAPCLALASQEGSSQSAGTHTPAQQCQPLWITGPLSSLLLAARTTSLSLPHTVPLPWSPSTQHTDDGHHVCQHVAPRHLIQASLGGRERASEEQPDPGQLAPLPQSPPANAELHKCCQLDPEQSACRAGQEPGARWPCELLPPS